MWIESISADWFKVAITLPGNWTYDQQLQWQWGRLNIWKWPKLQQPGQAIVKLSSPTLIIAAKPASSFLPHPDLGYIAIAKRVWKWNMYSNTGTIWSIIIVTYLLYVFSWIWEEMYQQQLYHGEKTQGKPLLIFDPNLQIKINTHFITLQLVHKIRQNKKLFI